MSPEDELFIAHCTALIRASPKPISKEVMAEAIMRLIRQRDQREGQRPTPEEVLAECLAVRAELERAYKHAFADLQR